MRHALNFCGARPKVAALQISNRTQISDLGKDPSSELLPLTPVKCLEKLHRIRRFAAVYKQAGNRIKSGNDGLCASSDKVATISSNVMHTMQLDKCLWKDVPRSIHANGKRDSAIHRDLL